MITINDKKKCCGCSACANVCPKGVIEMQMDEEGFLYPFVNKAECIECGLCEQVCPVLHCEKEQVNQEQKAALVQHKDRNIVRESTAGGAFTAIAEYVIDKGGIVFGVTREVDNTIHHVAVETKEELAKFRNSKYVQSTVEDAYIQVKKQLFIGKLVCFSGTPCQIEGLRHYLRKEYDNLILVDVVCRAVPSPGMWKRYIEHFESKNGKSQSIRFRDKTLGYQYSTMEIINDKGNVFRGGIESQLWLRMFFSGMIIRPSCTDCKFRKQYRNSDFTIWDCFNVKDIDKTFDEDCGTTRVLIHSKKAYEIFREIESSINYKMMEPDKIVEGVAEVFESPKEHVLKKQFFSDAQKLESEELFNKYFPTTPKIKLKKFFRLTLNKIGLDKLVKRILRKLRNR